MKLAIWRLSVVSSVGVLALLVPYSCCCSVALPGADAADSMMSADVSERALDFKRTCACPGATQRAVSSGKEQR